MSSALRKRYGRANKSRLAIDAHYYAGNIFRTAMDQAKAFDLGRKAS
jgi:hypothetical protein